MNYTNNIEKRNRIMQKTYNNEKLTKQERYWLITNPLFNTSYTQPIYLQDIIALTPNCLYSISVKVESTNCDYEIYPQIGVAGLKGKIITQGQLKNIDNKNVDYNETKILVLRSDECNSDSEIEFVAEDGFLSVGYYCSFYDKEMNVIKKMSSACNLSFGMQKRVISDNCIEYRCKSIYSESFDAMVFVLEWNNQGTNQKKTNKT